jgi:hypothetical protein
MAGGNTYRGIEWLAGWVWVEGGTEEMWEMYGPAVFLHALGRRGVGYWIEERRCVGVCPGCCGVGACAAAGGRVRRLR